MYPEKEKENRETLEKLMFKAVEEAQQALEGDKKLSFRPTIFFGLESLVEFLRQEEEATEQSEIAEAVCAEEKIPFYRLSPSEARRRSLPRILPRREAHLEAPFREEVLIGLKRLLEANPLLTVYQDLQKFIQDAPAWTL